MSGKATNQELVTEMSHQPSPVETLSSDSTKGSASRLTRQSW